MATTTPTKETRAEVLAKQLAKLRAERDGMNERFQLLPDLAFESRLEAIRANPGERSDAAVNSRPRRLSKEQQELIRSMDTADEEIRALEIVFAEANQEDLEKRFQSLADEAERIWAEERKAWMEAGRHFAALIETRGALAALWQKREQVKAERAGEFVDLLNVNEQARETLAQTFRHRIRPVPFTVQAFLGLLTEAVCDLRGQGYRDVGGMRLDHEGELAGLLPDLRHDEAVRPVSLSELERRE